MTFMRKHILSLGLWAASTLCAIYPAIADDYPIKGVSVLAILLTSERKPVRRMNDLGYPN
jgi:hypothetical protein